MKRLLVLLSLAVSISLSCRADMVSVPIKIQTKFYSTYDYDTFNATWYGPDGSKNWSHSGYTSTSPTQHLQAVPGREYYVVVYGIDTMDTYDLFISPPPGMEAFVSGPYGTDFQEKT